MAEAYGEMDPREHELEGSQSPNSNKFSRDIKIGSELIFDGNKWGIVDDVTNDGMYIVVDKDGEEHTMTGDRVDHVY